MLVAAAVVPASPLLVPEVAAGAAGDLAGVRAAAVSAVRGLVGTGLDHLVVAGAADGGPRRWGPGARWSLAGLGVDLAGRCGTGHETGLLPTSLAVGAWLLSRAGVGLPGPGAVTVDADTDVAVPGGRWGLLVVGDLSARRSTAAPGYLDPRAEPFDAAVGQLLRSGDAAGLRDLDPVLGAELMAEGVAPLRALGRAAVGAGWDAEVTAEEAPHGVGLVVAGWRRRG